ncbi:MAG: 16S rRNA (cytosine(967)-C(5))-methyltransferase RsmB [Syntrophotaleaceae bacterium]
MKKTDVRRLAFEILTEVEDGAFSDQALDAVLAANPHMDDRDRRLLTELVYGVLRYRGRLDYALSCFCRQPLTRIEPAVVQLLRLGGYQLLLLDRIPQRAAVHETVELARRLGLARVTGFINGILRALIRGIDAIPWPDRNSDPRAYLQRVLSLPNWLAGQWLDQYGCTEALALAEAMLKQAPFTVRVNTQKTTREAFLAALQEAGYRAEATAYVAEGVIVAEGPGRRLPGDREGWYQVQDEASMLMACLIAPKAGERLLDCCAAPGGKTTHLAALADNRAEILALDIDAERLALVEQGARRLGLSGIACRTWDVTSPSAFLVPDSFDRVLVDAPCSGLGVLRRNPESRWRRTPDDLRTNSERQSMLLDRVAPLVRLGGRLFYSVCTLAQEETTVVAERFLSGHGEFSREDLREQAPQSWQELFDEQGALRTFPHRHHGMDAFYAVSFRRN